MPALIVSEEFLLWAELGAFWAAASYGVVSDPLEDQKEEYRNRRWRIGLIARGVFIGIIFLLKSHSFLLTSAVVILSVTHPLLRYRIPFRKLAEFECLAVGASLGLMWLLVRHWHLTSCWTVVHLSMTREHIAALAIVATTVLVMERGGTYIVRGCLRKADTLPRVGLRNSEIDAAEINRGRLIGNLERLVLTVVVAAGSYAALGFLVAAKGLIRSEEFQNRDFTEYFLVGSLASVLVALCAGLILRFALMSLWPELFSLNMQS